MGTQAFIVQHVNGHRYSAWVYPKDARQAYAKRTHAGVIRKYGPPAWSIIVPDDVVEREIHTTKDWDKLTPETPGVVLYSRNGRLCG